MKMTWMKPAHELENIRMKISFEIVLLQFPSLVISDTNISVENGISSAQSCVCALVSQI
jgi:hypothetical protein